MPPQNPLVHDPEVRTRFMDLIRAGHGRYEAARAVGLTPKQFTYAHDRSDEFRRQLEQATDASCEDVFSMLRKRAIEEGDVTAAKEYLRHMAPPPRGSAVTVNHRHSMVELPSNLAEVGTLAERLEQRLAELEAGEQDIEDAELVEEDEA